MLQIKHLNIVHKKDLHTILEDFSFSLGKGDRAVIIGEEGNGKSTLLKWIADPALVEPYAEAQGERICSGERLGYLPQEFPQSESSKSIYEYFCEEESFWEQTPQQLSMLAKKLHLDADFFYSDQKTGTLSGGEKVKLQMARLLIAQPTVLLLDEPSNDIDIETLEWLEELMLRSGLPVIFISHDETLIERTANVIIHLEQLRRKTVSRYSVTRAAYREYTELRAARMEKQRAEAANERRQEKIRREKFQRIQQKVEQEQRAVSRQDPHTGRLLKKKMKAVKSLEHRYEREASVMTRMPESEDAIFLKFESGIHMPAGKVVLDFSMEALTVQNGPDDARVLAKDIALLVRGPQKVCITGKNGAGKTTLLKQIAASLLARTDIHAAYMPQNYEEQPGMEKTPVEYLSVTGDKDEQTRIRTYLGSMKYTADEMEHPAAELSGGQKAKLFLLKMSMCGADVLILDEPTRNFSPLSGPVIRSVLASFGGAIISISHDRKYIAGVCDCVYELTENGLVKAGQSVVK